MNEQDILKAAGALGVMGSSAVAAPRVLALLCNPTASAGDIAAVIGQEPALAARVLRVANSSYYGLARNITTVDRALLLLGLDAVRGIAAAACLDRALQRGGTASPTDNTALLRHSLATAAAAEMLSRTHRLAAPADAFMAGLLHNLGVIVQQRIDPAGVTQLRERLAQEPQMDLRTLEQSLTRIGHEPCGATVFASWQLPPQLVEVARHHHRPAEAPAEHRLLCAVVAAATQLAVAGGFSHALEPRDPALSVAAAGLLQLDAAALDELASALPERVADLQVAMAA